MPASPEEFLQQFLAGQQAQPGASAKPRVYWGQKVTSGFDSSRDSLVAGRVKKGDDVADLDWAANQFYTWSDPERAAWGQRLYKGGLIKDPGDYDAMLSAWKYAVEQAANLYTHGKKKITPWQVVDMLDGLNGDAAGQAPKTTRQNQTSYQIPSESEAQTAVTSIFQDQLGRDPTEGELARYRSMWIGQAKKNPTVTTTTSTTDAMGNTTQSSTSKGGFDPRGFLVEQAQGDPEYGALQSATTYYNALQQLVRSPL